MELARDDNNVPMPICKTVTSLASVRDTTPTVIKTITIEPATRLIRIVAENQSVNFKWASNTVDATSNFDAVAAPGAILDHEVQNGRYGMQFAYIQVAAGAAVSIMQYP